VRDEESRPPLRRHAVEQVQQRDRVAAAGASDDDEVVRRELRARRVEEGDLDRIRLHSAPLRDHREVLATQRHGARRGGEHEPSDPRGDEQKNDLGRERRQRAARGRVGENSGSDRDEEGHDRREHLLTGPASLTQREQVQIIGDAIGRPVRFEKLSRESAREQMLAMRFPPPIADMLLDAYSAAVGLPALVTSSVFDVTGTPARSFRDWALDHSADFAMPS